MRPIFQIKNIKQHIYYILLLFLSLFSTAAFATDNSCTLKDISPEKIKMGIQASLSLESWLNNTEAEVAVIARQGQSLLKYGITFSHAAFAVKELETNRWIVHHQLNGCPKNSSQLHKESINLFFMNSPKAYQAAVVIPTPEIQQKLKKLLLEPSSINQLYHPQYSAVAYPFSLERQNSNSWILEVFAKAVSAENVTERKTAQEWLAENQYAPTIIKTSSLKKTLASLFISNISLKGHPKEHLQKGELWVNSGDSTLKFISKYAKAPINCPEGNLGGSICIIDELNKTE